jgi:hypothetical protein
VDDRHSEWVDFLVFGGDEHAGDTDEMKVVDVVEAKGEEVRTAGGMAEVRGTLRCAGRIGPSG